MYLESFTLPSPDWEELYRSPETNWEMKRTCYTSYYPFGIFPEKQLTELRFAPVTFLYGGNGSGKTTLLNLIAERLRIRRGTYFNRSNFFADYVAQCSYEAPKFLTAIADASRMITSDDVFDYLLDLRCLNEQVDLRREDLLAEYAEERHASFRMSPLEDYEKLKRNNAAKRLTGSKYVKKHVMQNVREQSNGESAFRFFTEHIKEDALYLLDEPENSLAADLQLQLSQFIADTARFYHCQFIIATHSPFLLAMPHCRIYDLDAVPVTVKPWTELGHVRTYFDFFEQHREAFGVTEVDT